MEKCCNILNVLLSSIHARVGFGEQQVKGLEEKSYRMELFLTTFVKWVLISIVIGLIGGAVGTLFYICVEKATAFRMVHNSILWFLPLGGLAIVALCRLTGLGSKGTDYVLRSVYTDGKVPLAMAPVIFVSTVITHLFGGSAGREGAALQIGGSIGSQIGRLLKLDENDLQIAIMCGMSTVFAALFGTPLTAAFFAMEVTSIGVMHYAAFIPCTVSAFTAAGFSSRFGVHPVHFLLASTPALSALNLVRTGILAAMCALLSIVFCLTMKVSGKLFQEWFQNEYVRVAAGGLLLLALTWICGTQDYNGAGMDIIRRAIAGHAVAHAILSKSSLWPSRWNPVIKGRNCPTFFIGATGCIAGGLWD